MTKRAIRVIACLLLAALLLCGCPAQQQPEKTKVFNAGFGNAVLELPEDSDQPLYIAGYHQGWQITGLRDAQQARALWLDDGDTSVLLIVVDCIGLSSATVGQIRSRLADFCRETGCDSVNVIATHTHAGVDTLGLWGPMAMDGKNDDFMRILIDGAVSAAKAAYADRCAGALCYVETPAQGLQEDSRAPQIYDRNLYQLRFVPDDPQKSGTRLISFAAHAEALRGDNTLVSRDYPGVVCDLIYEQTGDNAIFLPGAIGGLIKTPELTGEAFDGEQNLLLTGDAIAQYAVSQEQGRELEPNLAVSRVQFETKLENTIFLYYKFLGILGSDVRRDLTGSYYLTTELTVLRLGDLTMALLPGEIFPELLLPSVPGSIGAVAKEHGAEDLMVVGLANDEIGYIMPRSDFVVDDQLPYFREAQGDHYEETNSVGPDCEDDLSAAFTKALQNLTP